MKPSSQGRVMVRRYLSTLLGALVLAIVGGVAPALAAETRVPLEAFGPDGTGSSSFGYIGGLAFDQGNKNLYALDQEAEDIYGFDESVSGTHTPLGGEFPVHAAESEAEAPDDIAVDSSSHHFYYLSEWEESVYGFEADGTELLSGFPFHVEPYGYMTVDPSGNIWVASPIGERVVEYSAAGSKLTSVSTPENYPYHVAFDAEGNMYLSMYGEGVWKYTAASGFTSGTEIVVGGTGTGKPIAVDRSTGDLYVVSPSRVNVYSITGEALYEFGGAVSGAEFGGIAIDETDDRVYLANSGAGQIEVFGPPVPLPTVASGEVTGTTDHAVTFHGTVTPEGEALTECVFEYGTSTAYGQTAPCVPAAGSIDPEAKAQPVSAEVSSLSPGTTYHFRVAASTAKGTSHGHDRTFTTAIGAPTISDESASLTTPTEATVTAQIDPDGSPTTYLVEYGPTASYGQSTTSSGPVGFAGEDSQQTLSVHLEGLTPGADYHFRFVAVNVVSITKGSDATFGTYGALSAFGPCSNETYRSGPSAALPDCRAYEQVSPADKLGGGVLWGEQVAVASANGDRVTFADDGGLPTTGGEGSEPDFLSSRSEAGWSTDGLFPLTEPGIKPAIEGADSELAVSISDVASGPGEGLYLRTSETGAESRIVGPETLASFPYEAAPAAFAAGEPDHLILETEAQRAPGSSFGHRDLYELDHGAISLADLVPEYPAVTCTAASCVAAPNGAFAGAFMWELSNLEIGGALTHLLTKEAMSTDGSKMFFTEAGTGRLYMREADSTVQISAPEEGVSDPNGEKAAAFVGASSTGSRVFFLSCQRLTADSTAVSTAGERTCGTPALQGQDLYAYDSVSGQLTDLTVDHEAGDTHGAQVVGVLGTSSDGSDIYFAANGILAAGASPGTCPISRFEPEGSCNVYLAHLEAGHAPAISFVASVETRPYGSDANWTALAAERASRVSADGTLLFGSKQDLAGYESHGTVEFYRYAPGDTDPTCVSCDPSGAAPTGPPSLQPIESSAAFFPTHVPGFVPRNISADGGRVFFETPAKLVAGDTNGDHGCPGWGPGVALTAACTDVYEWETPGEGSCTETASAYSQQDQGCLYLISSGKSSVPAFFGDASEDGDDVFFFTEQQLVPQDKDQLFDVYDARVNGGLAAQNESEPVGCSGEGCRPAPSAPPSEPIGGSSVFSGPGNLVSPLPVATSKPAGKPQSKKKKKKKKKKRKATGRKVAHKRRRAAYKPSRQRATILRGARK